MNENRSILVHVCASSCIHCTCNYVYSMFAPSRRSSLKYSLRQSYMVTFLPLPGIGTERYMNTSNLKEEQPQRKHRVMAISCPLKSLLIMDSFHAMCSRQSRSPRSTKSSAERTAPLAASRVVPGSTDELLSSSCRLSRRNRRNSCASCCAV